jgi:hypothetical protein
MGLRRRDDQPREGLRMAQLLGARLVGRERRNYHQAEKPGAPAH